MQNCRSLLEWGKLVGNWQQQQMPNGRIICKTTISTVCTNETERKREAEVPIKQTEQHGKDYDSKMKIK